MPCEPCPQISSCEYGVSSNEWQGCWGSSGDERSAKPAALKSEDRNPKAEGRPKAECRKDMEYLRALGPVWRLTVCEYDPANCRAPIGCVSAAQPDAVLGRGPEPGGERT